MPEEHGHCSLRGGIHYTHDTHDREKSVLQIILPDQPESSHTPGITPGNGKRAKDSTTGTSAGLTRVGTVRETVGETKEGEEKGNMQEKGFMAMGPISLQNSQDTCGMLKVCYKVNIHRT